MDVTAQSRGPNCFGARPTVGLVLFDSKRKPVYFNSEALQILAYPLRFRNVKELEKFLPEILRTILPDQTPVSSDAAAIEFQSGRRRYVGRLVCMAHNSIRHSREITGLLIERSARGSISLSAAAERFRLTQRERQTVALLVVGLTSKEIASQLNVSANTVKTFVRLIMTKMAVPNRAGIVGKLIGA